MNFGTVSCRLKRTGNKNSLAMDSEVLLLQAFDLQKDSPVDLKVFEGKGNRMGDGIHIAREEKRDGVLKLGTDRAISLPGSETVVNFLRHPYSGLVRIEMNRENYEIDLYSEQTGILTLRLADGEAPRILASTSAHALRPQFMEGPHRLMVESLDKPNPRSGGAEIQVIEVRDSLRHFPISWDHSSNRNRDLQRGVIGHAGHTIPCTLRILKGEAASLDVSTPCPAVKLLRHPYSGKAKLKLGSIESDIDLYSPSTQETVFVADPEAGEFLQYACTSDTPSRGNLEPSPTTGSQDSDVSPLQYLELEESSPDHICGWACDLGHAGEVPVVELLCNGEFLTAAKANLPRPELAATKGIPRTNCGFRIPVPFGLLPEDLLEVRLAGSTLSLRCFESDLRSALFAAASNYHAYALIAHLEQ